MTPAITDDLAQVYLGDVRDVLRELPAESAQTCVTSPPYWGLRDYGTATWAGGDPECDHQGPPMRTNNKPTNHAATFHGGGSRANEPYRATCGRCGANRVDAQLGLEETPSEYVENMVAVFGEVRRVLRNDGTLWLNLGDSYNAYNGNRGASSGQLEGRRGGAHPTLPRGLVAPGLKNKDLVGIPWRVAFALQADGWYLRSDIIWHKPNPMPESVTDRPTKSHEYLFLLAKSERYYYDLRAVSEAAVSDHGSGNGFKRPARLSYAGRGNDAQWLDIGGRRNRRTVWTVPTAPYPGAHFAVYPPKLIEPCVLAGAPAGGVVLDPFAGSGTTLAVAKEHGRRSIGIELNSDYLPLIRKRLERTAHQPALFEEMPA